MRPPSILAGPAILAALALPASARGQIDAAGAATRSARVDSLFAPWSRPDGPGCAVTVVHGGRRVHLGLHGAALVEHDVPIEGSTVFDLASLSKHFTAAAIALLVEDGTVSWDDPVGRWIPELSAIHDPVRVHHLVHHTSGIREFFALWAFAGRDIENGIEDEEVLAMLGRQGALNFAPGERESYSNSNYFLLAEIVERAAGASMADFLRERLFRPLGMETTRVLEEHEDIVPGLAGSYFEREDGTLARRVLKNDVVGDSGLHTTIDDMTRWMLALLSDETPVGGLLQMLVERGTLTDGTRISYARGLRVLPLRGLETASHGGTMGGFRTYMVLVPDQGWGTVVLCNQLDTSPFRLTEAIAGIWFEENMSPAEVGDAGIGSPPPAESDDPVPHDIVGRWWSEELAAFHEFVRIGDRLAVRRGDLPAEDLTIVGPDELEMGGIRWRIERDADAGAARILVESGRASGVVLRPAD